MGARWLIAILLALLLGFLVLRQASVTAFASRDPARAAALWSSHPSVELESGLARIGEDAAAGKPSDAALVGRLLNVSGREPLAPEPFLVRGVQAMVQGDEALAGRAFITARQRNPRLVAARYFLAEHYLRTGETGAGLTEVGALVRLVPQSLPQVAPYLAAYARTPGAAPRVKALIRDHPLLEAMLLNSLAANARDSRLAIYLWSGRQGQAAKRWQTTLLRSLVNAGRFGEARAAWNKFSGSNADELVDAQFRPDRLAPFGWSFAADSSGVAEPQEGGQLHIIYYGRDDKVLASQLLMLEPGRYRLSMDVRGISPAAGSLRWKISCLPSSTQVASLPLNGAESGGKVAAAFAVAASGCSAQRLELIGTAPELAEQAEVTIGNLRLVGASPQ